MTDTPPRKQLLVDISEIHKKDLKTGIQRVVRNILAELIQNPPIGFRVEPVYASVETAGYQYARSFASQIFPRQIRLQNDDRVIIGQGDLFLGLDLAPLAIIELSSFYSELKSRGGRVFFLVYDLLPISLPSFFSEGSAVNHARWLNFVALMDGLICISKSVSDELTRYLELFGPARNEPLQIGWFHLAGDLEQSGRMEDLPTDSNVILDKLKKRPTFVMVGTVEPRKAHMQAIRAFDELWTSGVDINLIIVGKRGWGDENVIDRILNHSQFGSRLFWLSSSSDEFLGRIYDASTCLLAASYGEGFGLPLIEAAARGLPAIARDIAVFREITQDRAYFFSGDSPSDLTCSIERWLHLYRAGEEPKATVCDAYTWEKSAAALGDILASEKWQNQWLSSGTQLISGEDLRLGTQFGRREKKIVTAGQAGYLLFGPYTSLKAGRYEIRVIGEACRAADSECIFDVTLNFGELILARSTVLNSSGPCLARLSIFIEQFCTGLEIRAWVNAKVDMAISRIEIEKKTA